jgi:cyclopropane fatty-acyl-phospholipid synthase-like methyltransferase
MKNMNQLVRDAYNKCAEDYSSTRDLFKNKKYLDMLTGYLKPKSKILDIGCGAGKPIDEYLVSKKYKVTGIDISEKQIELAKINVPQAIFSVKDMSVLNFSKNSFDAVISFYAIFHIPREGHLGLFKKILEILKPSGYFLATLGFDNWEGSEEFHGVTMHWSQYSKDKNLKLIKEAGFEIVKAEIDKSGGEHHFVVLAKRTLNF